MRLFVRFLVVLLLLGVWVLWGLRVHARTNEPGPPPERCRSSLISSSLVSGAADAPTGDEPPELFDPTLLWLEPVLLAPPLAPNIVELLLLCLIARDPCESPLP